MEAVVDRGELERIEAAIVSLNVDASARMGRLLTLIAQFDAAGGARAWGYRSTAEWLGWRCSISFRTARDQVRVARRLRDRPRILAALCEGEISYSQARALARASTTESESSLLDLAASCTAAQLERRLRALRSAPTAEPAAAESAYENRGLDWWWDDETGHFVLKARFAPDDGAVISETVDTAAELLHGGPDCPPLGARRADALVEIMISGAPPAQVVLHADPGSLGQVCALEAGPAIQPEAARRLSCDADIGSSDHGRTRRVVSPALRRSIERRDGRCCAFPDCFQRQGLHAHHLTHWIHGGPTDADNLVLLCRFHHRLVHEGGFTVLRRNAELTFRRPDGARVLPLPPPTSAAEAFPRPPDRMVA